MKWERKSHYHSESEEGYSICVVVFPDKKYRYGAYAPSLKYSEFKALCTQKYQIGESMPQQSECLGCFDSPEDAKAACEDHYEKRSVDNGSSHEAVRCG